MGKQDGGSERTDTLITSTAGGRTSVSVGKPYRGLIKAFGVGRRGWFGCVLSEVRLRPSSA